MAKLTIGRKKITVVAALAGVPQKFTNTPIPAYPTDFTVYVVSGNLGANVYIGDKTVDSTWIPRPKGSIVNFVHGSGNMMGHDEIVGFDFSNWYFIGEGNGDTIVIEYMCRDKT